MKDLFQRIHCQEPISGSLAILRYSVKLSFVVLGRIVVFLWELYCDLEDKKSYLGLTTMISGICCLGITMLIIRITNNQVNTWTGVGHILVYVSALFITLTLFVKPIQLLILRSNF